MAPGPAVDPPREPARRAGDRLAVIEVDDWCRPQTRTMNVRAHKGVIVATSGSASNPVFRTMFDAR